MGLGRTNCSNRPDKTASIRLGKRSRAAIISGWLVSQSITPPKDYRRLQAVIIREVPAFTIRHKKAEITIAEGRQGLIV